MLRNYFKVALKNLNRFRLVSSINLIGLTIGFGVFGVIFLLLITELSYDRFHSKIDRLYRLTTEFRYPGIAPSTLALSAAPMAPHIQRQFNNVEAFARLRAIEANIVYRSGNQEVVLNNALEVDTSFFQLFDFQLMAGNAKTALKNPASIVLTEKIANQLFAKDNPMGKIITRTYALNADRDTTVSYLVTGVLKNIPQYSHLQFDALFNVNEGFTLDLGGQEWHSVVANTYFLTKSPIQDITAFENNIAASLANVMAGSKYVKIHIQPFQDIHLMSTTVNSDENNFQKFDKRYIRIFSLIALIVLAIAGVNFTNLATVIAHKRAKEIGIRKTLGANRRSVIIQFLGESLLLSFLAALMSLLFIDLILPYLQQFMNREIAATVFKNVPFLLTISGVVVVMGVTAGLYPAFYLSSFQPLAAMKKLQIGSKPRHWLVHTLVVAQFITATILIVGTLVIIQQLNFLKNQDKGFSINQILSINSGYNNWSKYHALKNEWRNVAGVQDVTAARDVLGGEALQTGIIFDDKDGIQQNIAVSVMLTDDNYLSFYDMKLVAGNKFSEGAARRSNEYIINETLAKQIGWEKPVGQPIRLGWEQEMGTIVGVVKDFNFNTLHHKITPLCIHAAEGNNQGISIKVNTDHLAPTLASLEKIWKQHIQDIPFDYQFLDEHFAKLYESETRIGRLMSTAAALAVFIACMGLFGIAAFTTEQRTKEIGIRKVLGASVGSIVELLSRDFMKLVFIAILIASPIAWWAMQQWLEGFAYRIEIKWWLFVLAGITAIIIALATVSFQAIRAAVANPVESLKNE